MSDPRRNDSVLAIREQLTAHSINYTMQVGKRNVKFKFALNGQNRTIICGLTPSDRRASLNARSHIRRMLDA